MTSSRLTRPRLRQRSVAKTSFTLARMAPARIPSSRPDDSLAKQELLDPMSGPDLRHEEIPLRVGGKIVHEDKLARVVSNPPERSDLLEALAVEDMHLPVRGIREIQPLLGSSARS